MTRKLFAFVALCAALVCSNSGTSAQQPVRSATAVPSAATHQATLQQSCVTCHNARLKTGGLAIDQLDVANVRRDAEAWEQVVRRLRVGAMPPRGVRRPEATASNALISWLEGELDKSGTSNPGRPTLRRLNRAEYANAIRDLLALDVDVTSLLPPDGSAFGFDNVAMLRAVRLHCCRRTSPRLAGSARWLSATRASGWAAAPTPHARISRRTFTSKDCRWEQSADSSATHTFPLDAEYDFQVRLYRTNLSAMRGLEDPQEVELTVDGERDPDGGVGGEQDLIALQTNPTDTSDNIEATRLRVRRFVKAGQRDVAAAFLEKTSPVFETHRLQRFIRDFANPFDAEGAPHVLSISIQGPFNAKGAETPPSPRVFACKPASAAEETACARRILSTLAGRAYRRPVANNEIADLMSSYDQGRSNGSFSTGVQFGLRRILASPSFVFRPEVEPAAVAVGAAYRISDTELASRLSFFLWSTLPDDQLLRVAREGRLSQPAVLREEVRRMLADPRSSAFVKNFAGQWLHLRNLRGIIPNSDLFPDFDDNLRQAFQREAELFFESVLRENRSVLDLMNGDYTFVNERLARHYGINGVFGSEFRRVRMSDPARFGLLGKGAVLLATSHPTTTSPVLRGKWVLENIVGTPPPAPPANLDTALKTDPPGSAPKTMREQMEQHRTSPVCASCHQTMDPIGFALENFDVVGKWRTQDRRRARAQHG